MTPREERDSFLCLIKTANYNSLPKSSSCFEFSVKCILGRREAEKYFSRKGAKTQRRKETPLETR